MISIDVLFSAIKCKDSLWLTHLSLIALKQDDFIAKFADTKVKVNIMILNQYYVKL